MRVDNLLTAILEATAEQTAAGRRVARLRAILDAEARRRYTDEGAAPTWKAPRLGSVRLDPKDAAPYVANGEELAAFLIDKHPDEVEAVIRVPAGTVEAALEALTFAGIDGATAEASVRPAFLKPFLDGLEVTYTADEETGEALLVDEASGESVKVPGVGVTAPGATLVVTLDPQRKRQAIADVDAELDADEAITAAAAEDAADEALAEAEAALDPLDAGTLGPAALTDRPPAPELSAEERATVDRFEAAPDAFDAGDVPTTDGALDERVLDRTPYVGEGADGARRSAEIDRNEADTLPVHGQPGYGVEAQDRRAELLTSADLWEAQAQRLEAAGG